MNRLIAASSFGLLAITFSSTAFAWTHLGHTWAPEDMPIPYHVSFCNEDPDDGSDCDVIGEDSIEGVYVDADGDEVADSKDGEPFEVWVTKAGFAEWKTAPCTEFTTEFEGTVDDNMGFETWDTTHVTWDDPNDELAVGVLAATMTYPFTLSQGDYAFSKNGMSYWKAEDSDIVFNDNVDFAPDFAVSGQTSMQSVMTHEQGHLLGLGHSCEEEDICNDAELKEATMYWASGPGDINGSTIGDDDQKSLMALYGPFATFSCSHELDPDDADTIAQGNIPFDLKCIIESENPAEIISAEWAWGDGSSDATTGNASHRYETDGNFTIETTFVGERDTCEGQWDYSYRRIGYVRACDVPQPEFVIDHVDGMAYTLANETDVSVYGCIYEIQWDIFKGDTLVESINAWEPTVTFEEEGDYRVVLNIGGPAGTGAAEVSFNAYDHRGEGYSCSAIGAASGSLSWLFIVGASAAAFRRRQS